jgi:hypothetical protein
MKAPFRYFLSALPLAGLVAMAGCVSTGSGSSVDYQTLATNACGLATSEIAALQSVQSDLSANDQATLAKVSAIVVPGCAAITAASAEGNYQSVLPELTVLAVLLASNKLSVPTQ